MVKKWAGLTEKRWRKHIEWYLTDHKLTNGSRWEWCYRNRRLLQLSGEWETFPKDLKWKLQVWAHLYEKTYPAQEKEVNMAIAVLEKQKGDIDEQIMQMQRTILNYGGLG
ncbi:MAG: hypothetical protein LBB89_12390 [Treponema sp.]|jgi:hypothetical protein|nr:hypothetical protein [Treponema sp.]